MKTNDRDIDDLIRETLSNEEAAYYDQLEDKNMLQEYGGVFKSRYGWAAVATGIMIFVLLGVVIYSGFAFANATSLKMIILWSMVIILSASGISMLKLWNWMQMDKNEIKREIKRVEYQISVLASHQGQH